MRSLKNSEKTSEKPLHKIESTVSCKREVEENVSSVIRDECLSLI